MAGGIETFVVSAYGVMTSDEQRSLTGGLPTLPFLPFLLPRTRIRS